MIKNIKISHKDDKKLVGTITLVARDMNGKETHRSITKNLIMIGNQTGQDILIQYLGGNGIAGGINYGAIGTNNTTPTVNDTQLGTESARTIVAAFTDNSFLSAKIQFYFPDAALTNQTYYEFGTFAGATATANSGSIFNHALFSSPYAKTAGNNTTVEVDIAFS